MKNLKFYLLIFTLSSSVILLSFVLLPKEEISKKKLFDTFITSFDKAELPYEIAISNNPSEENQSNQTSESTHSDKLISHNFSAFIPGLAQSMFSRMPPSRYYFKDVIYENEDFVLVTYGIQSYRSIASNAVDEYVLASYSKKEKTKDVDRLLSSRTIAKSNYHESLKSIIGEDLMIKTTVSATSKINDDELEQPKETATERYKIAKDGKIKVVITKKVPQKKGTVIRAN